MIKDLTAIVGSQNIITSQAGLAAYGYDATLMSQRPGGIVFPRGTEDASAVVKYASQAGLVMVPRGAGTNLSGGSLPLADSLVVCLSRMTRILEIDPENFTATVEAGLVNYDLQEALEPYGYYYPPDPASYKASTLGGNIAECSGGPRCFKYGVTRDYILGLEVVLPSGKVIEVGGKNFKSEFRYDLTRLLVGSEGTLGLVTKAILRILPKPFAKRTMLAIYNKVEDASRTVADIVAAGIIPTTLEMMDNLLINTADEHVQLGLPRDAGALLIIEVDGYEVDLDKQVRLIEDLCNKAAVRSFKVATSQAEADQLWLARRTVIGSVGRRRPSYSLQDVTIPRSTFPQMVDAILACSRRYDLPIGILAHAGDGNFHPLVLFDERDADEVVRVHKAEVDLIRDALALGGTMSGEHGIGVLKKEYLDWEFSGAAIESFRKIKRSFDPAAILNRGKIVDIVPEG
jgi:glycolate oxidase